MEIPVLSIKMVLLLSTFVILQFQGATLKVMVLEETEVRMGVGESVFGVSHVLSKATDYETLHEITMPEKLIPTLKRATNKSILLKGYGLKQDGNIRLTETSTVRIIYKNIKPSI